MPQCSRQPPKAGSTSWKKVRIRDNKRVKDLSARLLEMGIYAIGICYPAVRDKDARIRISILATHTEEDILRLSSALEAILSGPQA